MAEACGQELRFKGFSKKMASELRFEVSIGIHKARGDEFIKCSRLKKQEGEDPN